MGVRKLLTLLGVAAAFLAAASTSQARTSQFTLFEAPRELLSSNDALRQETLDQIQGMGVKWIRVVLYWKAVAPAPGSSKAPAGFDGAGQAGYNWSRYDAAIGEARARGMNVLVTISGPIPKWASGNHRSYTYKPSFARFQRFVTAVGNRYRDQVSLWSVWNEPNHPDFLTPQFAGRRGHRTPYSPKLYRGLFLAAKRGLVASGNRRDKVLMGETAPRGTGSEVAPLRFLRGVLAPRGRFPADGYAHHAYTTASGPWFRPHNPDDVTIGVLSRLTRALDAEARAHRLRRGLPIYLTEFGIQSYPDRLMGVPQQKQAEFRSISEWMAYRNPRVVAFSQYLMRDDNPHKGSIYVRYSGFESGLRLADGAAKMAYAGFRLPLVARLRGHHVYLWGLVRPATGRTGVLLQIRKRRSKRWANLKHISTNSRGYWTSSTARRAGAQYRVVWGSFKGPATRAY